MTTQPRFIEIHPGTPGYAKFMVSLRVVRESEKALLVEHPTDPRGQVWIPKSIAGNNWNLFGKTTFHLPIWFWRKIADKL